MQFPKETSQYIFAAAVRAANPSDAVRRECLRIRSLYRAEGFSRLVALGFGKAAVPMALALGEELGDILETGVVVTKYGHASSRIPETFRIIEAGHPTPDENGIRGTLEILHRARTADEKTLVTALISGGGSALLTAPAEGITLAAKRDVTDLLLRAGADIHSLNTVRKHLSRVKGGRLAETIHPGRTVSLILSDVIGDDLDVIASGPTAPDTTTYRDALAVLERFDLAGRVPAAVAEHLKSGARGDIPETPKEGNPVFQRVENMIIGSNRSALEAASRAAEEAGCDVEILPTPVAGEAVDAGRMLARRAREYASQLRERPLCLLSGGETTVTVLGGGAGGRSQELALSFALEIAGIPGITLLSAGTDGTDGPTDAAGALVDGDTIPLRKKDAALRSLAQNDSYTFFKEHGGLFITGPTGTNVMDVQIICIRPQPDLRR
jgi:hydroxypyruvate reductase/glycerate 2-kinase